MQIDAHTDFLEDWDVKSLNQWGAIDNEYAVLSTQLADVSLMKSLLQAADTSEVAVPHLCQATLTPQGLIGIPLPLKASV